MEALKAHRHLLGRYVFCQEAKDYERKEDSREAFVYLGMIRLMLVRLA